MSLGVLVGLRLLDLGGFGTLVSKPAVDSRMIWELLLDARVRPTVEPSLKPAQTGRPIGSIEPRIHEKQKVAHEVELPTTGIGAHLLKGSPKLLSNSYSSRSFFFQKKNINILGKAVKKIS